MDGNSIEARISNLQERIVTLPETDQEIKEEFDLLFSKSLDDRPMALGRARRLLEIFVADHYISINKLAPPFRKKLKPLYEMIEELAKKEQISQTTASLCHAIRLEGNRVLHYLPNYPHEQKRVEVADDKLAETLQKLIEVAEATTTGGYSIYRSSLPEPFAAMYEMLREYWYRTLKGKQEGMFPLFEALELLFRSVVCRMQPEWLQLLARYGKNNILPDHLSSIEEDALRQLRNLGLIKHDGMWLFSPTRSTRVWPTSTGQLMLALDGQLGGLDAEQLAHDVIKNLRDLEQDELALLLLDRIQQSGYITDAEKGLARRLRNLHLLTHSTYFLEAADKLILTDLGYYVLGKYKKSDYV